MLLIGYLYGITSERRLAQEVSLHLAYRWFLGYDFDVSTPDHSVRSKARTRLGSEVFEEFFRQSIELCRQAGLLEEGPVYVDSTLMRASASMDSLTKREGREHFTWLPEEDAYLCPAQEKLKRYANVRSTSRVQYRAPKGSCVACAFRAECAPSGGERTIHRSWAQEFVEVNEERLASPLGKQRLTERQAYAEGPFGLAKELHGLRGTRFRGRRKVQIQLWLTAAAMNIKKAVRSTAASPELGGLPLLLASLAAFLSLGRWSLAPRAAEN